jgi:hypothetical protein
MIEDRFSALKGLTVDAAIPLPQRLINEIIQSALQGNKNIEYCVATILGENRVSVNLKTNLWPWPFDLKLRLEKLVDLTGSPNINARLENNLLLGKLGLYFKALPEWVDIDGDQVVLDIGAFLTPEQTNYLGLVKSVEIETEPGKAIFNVRIRVD